MAGSDDREAEEFTLLERLAVIAGHSKTDAQFNVADVADEAFDEIQRLREATALLAEWKDAQEAIFTHEGRDGVWRRLADADRALLTYARTIQSALAPATVADTAAAPGPTDPPVAAAVSGAAP
jgi:hypothetical protein